MKASSVGCLLHTQSAIYPLQQSLSNHDHSDSAGETDNDRLKKKKKNIGRKKNVHSGMVGTSQSCTVETSCYH